MNSNSSINPKSLFRLVIGGDFIKLKEEGFVARRGLPPIPITFPMKWRSKDSNVEFNLHAWRFLNSAWSYYIKNQSDEVAKEVFDFSISIAKDWLSFLEDKKSKYAWYDMSVGIRAMHITFMKYLCCTHGVFERRDELLVDKFAECHIKWLSNQRNITSGNHAVYQVVGLRTLCELYEREDLKEYLNENMERLLDAAFDVNFVSTENSPFYHGYNLALFRKVDPLLFPDLKNKIESCVFEGANINKWLTAPSGEYYRIGDTEGDGKKLTAKDVSQEGFYNPKGIVFKDLGRSGYQVIRSHPSCEEKKSFSLIFRGANLSKTHAHCDALSFIFYYEGKEVFSDPGKYTYEYGQQRSWVISDSSHNTAGLEDAPFFPKDVSYDAVYMHPILRDDEGYNFIGEVKKGIDFFHKREIFFHPDKKLILRDRVVSDNEKNKEIRLYLGAGFKVVNRAGGLQAYMKEGPVLRFLFSGDVDEVRFFNEEDASAYVSLSYGEKRFVSGIVINSSAYDALVETKIILDPDNDVEGSGLTHLHLREVFEKAPSSICRDGTRELIKSLKNSYCLKRFLDTALKGSPLEVSSVYGGSGRCSQSFVFSLYNALEFRDGDRVFYIIQNISLAFPFVIYLPDENLVFSNRTLNEVSPIINFFYGFLKRSTVVSGVSTSSVSLGGIVDGYPRPYHYFYDMAPFIVELLANVEKKITVFYAKDRPSFVNHAEIFDSVEPVFLSLVEEVNSLGGISLMPSRGYWPEVRGQRRENYTSVIKGFYYNDELMSEKYSYVIEKGADDFFIWLGLCDEKRSWVESKEFYRKVIDYLAGRHKKVFVALDGLTDTVPSFLSKDRGKVSDIELTNSSNVSFIDLRYSLAKEKIFLGGFIDFFITNSLTDSMWVAHFSEKPGLGFSAKGSRVKDHSHPRTEFFPKEMIENLEEKKNWSKVSFSICPDKAFYFFKKRYLSLKEDI